MILKFKLRLCTLSPTNDLSMEGFAFFLAILLIDYLPIQRLYNWSSSSSSFLTVFLKTQICLVFTPWKSPTADDDGDGNDDDGLDDGDKSLLSCTVWWSRWRSLWRRNPRLFFFDTKLLISWPSKDISILCLLKSFVCFPKTTTWTGGSSSKHVVRWMNVKYIKLQFCQNWKNTIDK